MMKKKEIFLYVAAFFVLIAVLVIVIIYLNGNSTLSAVFSTLIGSGLTFLISRFYQTIKTGHSQFSGYYRDEIFSLDNPTEIIKRDKFRLTENDGRILSGSFARYVPAKNRYTNWKCSGFVVLDQFLLAYRAVNDTTPSRGVILVKLDTERKNGLLPCYKGRYYKFEGEKIVSHIINLIKIDEAEYNSL